MSRAVFASALASIFVLAAPARADEGCHVVDVDFKPLAATSATPPQIAVWLTSTDGTFLRTIYITQSVGTYGLGNRPGRFDFNSGPQWPYGRRITALPIWAQAHGTTYPEVDFQNGLDSDLSHPFDDSSPEVHFCRPMAPNEPTWDAQTCASAIVFSDKGVFGTNSSKYPPRADVVRHGEVDSPSVDMYAMLNGLDAVSAATPTLAQPAEISWPIPADLPVGDYVLWFEVSEMDDHNATYSVAAYPAPTGIAFQGYGKPYRGQPSLLFQVPFAVGTSTTVASTDHYAGYGDPTGADGNVRAPDSTITTGMDGTGEGRLALVGADSLGPAYRVRVVSRNEFDAVPPGAATDLAVASSTARTATVAFTAPGEDGTIGKVTGYEVRYAAGVDSITDDASFAAANQVNAALTVVDPGMEQDIELTGLLPETTYTMAVRAFDDCHNTGPIAALTFTTPQKQVGEVDACFVATAAYGSVMANDVEKLRQFRDSLLKRSTLGELFVESYYTFGPAVAGVVGESDVLRETARDALRPLVERVRHLRF